MRTNAHLPLLVILTSCGATAQAAEWQIDPTLRFNAGYDDNLRLSTANEVSSAEATFSPSAVFSAKTPTSGISGNVRFDFRRFEDDSDLDDNNTRLDIQTFHDLERSRLGLDLGFIKDTTLDTQLEETGVAFDRVRRQSITASPNWRYTLSERSSLSANYSYRDVEYKDTSDARFVNYTLNSARTSLTRVMSEKTTAKLTLSGSRSNNDNDVESFNINLQAGGSFRFSNTLSASLFAGARRTETTLSNSRVLFLSGNDVIGETQRDATSNSSGSTFDASITKTFLRGKIDLSASRNISSDSNGQPIEVTRLSSYNLYRVNETLTVTLDLSLYSSESGNNSINLNREYYQISPGFTWNLKKFWSLSGSYRYRSQTFGDTKDDATQNAAYLTLTYRWPRIAVSR